MSQFHSFLFKFLAPILVFLLLILFFFVWYLPSLFVPSSRRVNKSSALRKTVLK